MGFLLTISLGFLFTIALGFQLTISKAVLKHIFDDASNRVKRPISDVTGQSRIVDQYLGSANSTERLIVADALASMSRKLNSATTIEQWKSILED